jgi:periplasmic divalent cation tolerance protein
MSHLLVMTTLPDMALAEDLSRQLVDKSLAACVNILPKMVSIYRWKQDLQRGEEHQLMMKTTTDNYPALEQFIRQHHPYELPEIIAIPIAHGLPDYLAWVSDNCEKNT